MTNNWLKKWLKQAFILGIIVGLTGIQGSMAQNIPNGSQEYHAEIDVNPSGKVDKNIIFDASKSTLPGDSSLATYQWDFGDGKKEKGENVTHSYDKIGNYTVTLEALSDKQTFKANADIFIYKKSLLVLTDQTEKKDRIDNLSMVAKTEGVELNILESFDSASEFISEEALTKELQENPDVLNKSNEIILWTQGNVGLNTLARFIKDNEDGKNDILKEKNIYIIDNEIDKNIFAPELQDINPKQLIITKEPGLYIIVTAAESSVIKMLEQGGYEYRVINEESRKLGLLNFMSYFVNVLAENGIPDNTIVLLLMLPIIATIIVFMRQVVGINTLGMYTPLIICLTFLILGLKFGMITLTTALIVGMGTRLALKKAHLLFMPKLGVMMIMITLSIFALLIVGISFKLFDSHFFSLAIFPMLILGSMTEKFTSIQSEAGFWKTIWLTAQTIITAIVAYIAVGGQFDIGILNFQWDTLRNFMKHYPEAILLFLLINILLGKWTGLRLVEYIRFREIFQHNEEE